nr:MAG TPA: hypothetical protein [Caudoviricetes sp.]
MHCKISQITPILKTRPEKRSCLFLFSQSLK